MTDHTRTSKESVDIAFRHVQDGILDGLTRANAISATAEKFGIDRWKVAKLTLVREETAGLSELQRELDEYGLAVLTGGRYQTDNDPED